MPISDPDLIHMPSVAMLSSVSHTKPLVLLAAAEESYSMSATVLKPVLKELIDNLPEPAERLVTGLHLLEEAMRRHNAYMDSLK